MIVQNQHLNNFQYPGNQISLSPTPAITNKFSTVYIHPSSTPSFSQVAQGIQNINVQKLINEPSVTPVGKFVDWLLGWGKKDSIANLTCEPSENDSLNTAVVITNKIYQNNSNTEENQRENLDEKKITFQSSSHPSLESSKRSAYCNSMRNTSPLIKLPKSLPEPLIAYLNDGINHLSGTHPVIYQDECCNKKMIVQKFTLQLGFFREPAKDSPYYPEFLEDYAKCAAEQVLKYFQTLQKEEDEGEVCFYIINQKQVRLTIFSGVLTIDSPDGFLLKQLRTSFTLSEDVHDCYNSCFDNYKIKYAKDKELEGIVIKKIAKAAASLAISYTVASIARVFIVRALNYMNR